MLTPLEAQQAAAMGWQLCEVFDLSLNRLRLMALPADFSRPASSERVQAHVMKLAKNNDPVAIKTLTAIAQYNMRKTRAR